MIVNWQGVSEPAEEQFPPVKRRNTDESAQTQTSPTQPVDKDDQSPFYITTKTNETK